MSNFKIITSIVKPKRILKSLILYLETLICPPGMGEWLVQFDFK